MSEVDHRTVVYQPWFPEADPVRKKVLGKAVEEGGEYVSALARCLLQGIDESEPQTGKPNRQWLTEEVADVIATMEHVTKLFGLDRQAIRVRAEIKHKRLAEWHEMK